MCEPIIVLCLGLGGRVGAGGIFLDRAVVFNGRGSTDTFTCSNAWSTVRLVSQAQGEGMEEGAIRVVDDRMKSGLYKIRAPLITCYFASEINSP